MPGKDVEGWLRGSRGTESPLGLRSSPTAERSGAVPLYL
jgi:hypothetical protein